MMPAPVPVLHLIFLILTKQIKWYKLVMSLASPDADASGITSQKSHIHLWWSWLNKLNSAMDKTVSSLWHWHKCYGITRPGNYVAHWFNHLGLIHTVVLLTISLAQYDAYASTSTVKWLNRSHVLSNFEHIKLPNALVFLMMPPVSCCTLFESSWPSKQNGAIDNVISVLWCSHWFHHHHMTKRVMLHLISLVFTWWTK